MARRAAETGLGADSAREVEVLAFSSPGLYSFCTVLKRDRWLEWLEWLHARMWNQQVTSTQRHPKSGGRFDPHRPYHTTS